MQRTVSARALWIRILTARVETGEPYLVFVDHVNNARPEHHKLAGLEVKTSNLCSEITLPTGIDHHGKQRTAVCDTILAALQGRLAQDVAAVDLRFAYAKRPPSPSTHSRTEPTP